MTAQTRFSRGETFTAGLKVRSGDVSTATCTMWLKKAVNGGPPGDAAPQAAILAVTYVEHLDPEDLTSPAAFIGVLDEDQSLALEPGPFVMDARLVVAGQVAQTDVVRVSVMERVTEAPGG